MQISARQTAANERSLPAYCRHRKRVPPLDSCARLVASAVFHAPAAREAERVGEEAEGIPILDSQHRNGFLLSRRGEAYAHQHDQQRHGFVDRNGEDSAVSTSKMPKTSSRHAKHTVASNSFRTALMAASVSTSALSTLTSCHRTTPTRRSSCIWQLRA